MKKRSYMVYSIACWVVWALIGIVRYVFSLGDVNHVILYVFLGWVIGWTGGVIAHKLYK